MNAEPELPFGGPQPTGCPRYPHAPGWKARETAKQAAEEMKPRAPTIQARIMDSMRKGYGYTPDAFAEAHGLSPLAVRPRFSELAKLGKIKDSGRRASNGSGRKAIIWVAS